MEEQFKGCLYETKFFDNQRVWAVGDGVVKKYLLEKLLSSWKVRGKKTFFPGPMAVSVTKVNLQNINSQPYMVCEKTDGERYIMFVTRIGEKTKVVLFINRNLDMYLQSLYFEDSVYDNTIIDGEMIKPPNRTGIYLFMSFDLVCCCGVNIKKNKLTERLSELHKLLSTKYNPKANIKVHMKKFFDVKQIDSAINTMNKYYPSDGLIFTPVDLAVQENTHYTLLKWKPNDTIDFVIESCGDTKYLSLTNLSDKKTKKIQKVVTPLDDGVIVECEYVDSEWIPNKPRPDKDRPNTTMTLERTMVTINDKINIQTIKDIINYT